MYRQLQFIGADLSELVNKAVNRLVSEFRESSCSLFGIESVLQRAGSKVQILAMRIGLS